MINLIKILFLLTLIQFVSSCEYTEYSGKKDINDPKFVLAIEKKMGLKFPPSVEWIGCQWDEWLDDTIDIGFRAKKSEVDEIFSFIKEPWIKTSRYQWDIKGIEWYKPDSIKDFRSVQVYYPNPRDCLQVIMDDSATTDSEIILVFVSCWL